LLSFLSTFAGTIVKNWGTFTSDTDEDFPLKSDSICLGDAAPASDMLGNLRRDLGTVPNTGVGTKTFVDIGPLERQAP
jgi:hypothetical protein